MSDLYVLDLIHSVDHRHFAGGQWVNDSRMKKHPCGHLDTESEPRTFQIRLDHLGRKGFTAYLWNSHGLPILRNDLVELWQRISGNGLSTKSVDIILPTVGKKSLSEDAIPKYSRVWPRHKVQLEIPVPTCEPCPICGYTQYGFPTVGTYLPTGISISPSSRIGSDICGGTWL